MEEQFLKDVSIEVKKWVQNQLKNKRFNRLDKMGRVISPSPRKLYGSGRLYNSVEVRIDNGEILILMESYGSDILFGEGRRSGAKPPPYKPILEWVRTIPTFAGLTQKEMVGVSIAISKNIGRRGYEALDLFREEEFEGEVIDSLEKSIEKLIEQDNYRGLGLNIDDVINNIILLSSDSMDIIDEI